MCVRVLLETPPHRKRSVLQVHPCLSVLTGHTLTYKTVISKVDREEEGKIALMKFVVYGKQALGDC